MADDIAQAMLRTRLVSDLEDARVTGETERLRSALLSSVSHDLRSPLAAIVGAAETLDTYGRGMGEDDRHSLLDTVRLEGERLDRYIQNLLDMTRLGHGGLTLNRDWIGVDELIGSAAARLQRYQPDVRFDIALAKGLAPLWVHPALVEQAIFNVIENAAKFSPRGRGRSRSTPATSTACCASTSRPWPRHPRGRTRAHLRHVLQRGARRPRPPGHRPGADDQPGHDRRAWRQRRSLPGPDGRGTTSGLPCRG
jgi:two-component system sensor histidine kinase KdpD